MSSRLLLLILVLSLSGCSLFSAKETDPDTIETEQPAKLSHSPIPPPMPNCESHCAAKQGLNRKLCQKKCSIKQKRAEHKQKHKTTHNPDYWTRFSCSVQEIVGSECKNQE
jgi:hypothetical protein